MFKLAVDDDINLCLLDESHAESYAQLAKENFEYLAKWMPWPNFCKTTPEFKAFACDSLHKYADKKAMNCAIEYKGKVVGNVGFNSIDHVLNKVEIGYWLAHNAQGKGIITRACKFLIGYAFEQLNMKKAQISVATENQSSRAVCERLGMTLEGIVTRAERIEEQVLDHAVYGLQRPA